MALATRAHVGQGLVGVGQIVVVVHTDSHYLIHGGLCLIIAIAHTLTVHVCHHHHYVHLNIHTTMVNACHHLRHVLQVKLITMENAHHLHVLLVKPISMVNAVVQKVRQITMVSAYQRHHQELHRKHHPLHHHKHHLQTRHPKRHVLQVRVITMDDVSLHQIRHVAMVSYIKMGIVSRHLPIVGQINVSLMDSVYLFAVPANGW
jgi:hypothetical protein